MVQVICTCNQAQTLPILPLVPQTHNAINPTSLQPIPSKTPSPPPSPPAQPPPPNPPHQTPTTAPTKPPPSFAPTPPPIPSQVTSANPPLPTSYPHTRDPPASCQLPLASPPNDGLAIRALAEIGEMLGGGGGGHWLTRVRFSTRFFPFKKSCTYHPINIYASTSVPLLVFLNFLGTRVHAYISS